jgi:ankyrin repeat protein
MKNESGDSALSCASKSGHIDCVRDLIDAGADVNARNRHGETALMFASYENRPELAQILLNNGADANLATNTGTVPLHAACKKNFTEVAQVLLEGGADPNMADKMGQRPLNFAVGSNNVALVTKLIQSGACSRYEGPSLFHRCSVTLSPLYKALWDKHLDIARVLHRAGSCTQNELLEIHRCEDLQSELEDTAKGKEVLAFIEDISHSPTSLRLSCLQRIQTCVKWGAAGGRERVMSLNLPKPLKDFLLFEDLNRDK